MKQLSFAQAEFAAKKKVTRRERFLAEMEQVVPWTALFEALGPHYFPACTGSARSPTHWLGADAADVLRTAVVQPRR